MAAESICSLGITTRTLLSVGQERREARQSWLGSCLRSEVQLMSLGLGFLFHLLCGG